MTGRRGYRRRTNATGRNTGEGQYAPLDYSMLKSPAWRSLSGPAVKVFLELRTRYNGMNNGKLALGMRKASELLHIGQSTVQRALIELAEKGFIDLTERGHWYGRRASTYAVTDRGIGDAPPTRAWRHRYIPPD